MRIFPNTIYTHTPKEKQIAEIKVDSKESLTINANEEMINLDLVKAEKEEWIWVEGYKGTTKDMQGYGNFQYELGVQYDMPEDAIIKPCFRGFHFCLNLKDVFSHYRIGNGNRFFKVKALVRKSDKDSYLWVTSDGKLAAKSIILLSELTIDEILKNTVITNLSEEYKLMAIKYGVDYALHYHQASILIEDGYSEAFAHFIANKGKFEIAHTVASQKDLSMDIKVLTIFYS